MQDTSICNSYLKYCLQLDLEIIALKTLLKLGLICQFKSLAFRDNFYIQASAWTAESGSSSLKA